MSANQCVEAHMRELMEQGFEVAVVKGMLAAAWDFGRSMRDSHQHLRITVSEWEAFLDDFKISMDCDISFFSRRFQLNPPQIWASFAPFTTPQTDLFHWEVAVAFRQQLFSILKSAISS